MIAAGGRSLRTTCALALAVLAVALPASLAAQALAGEAAAVAGPEKMVAHLARIARTADPIVVSTKGYVGHTLGAAGAMEAIFVLEALVAGWTPASVGASPLDEGIDLNVADAVCESELRLAISNSFAFGGSNVSLLFGAPV